MTIKKSELKIALCETIKMYLDDIDVSLFDKIPNKSLEKITTNIQHELNNVGIEVK